MIQRASDADAVLVSPGTEVTDEFLAACPNIKYVGICGTAKDNVDISAAQRRDITLTNVEHYGDEPTAEFIFMQLVALARGVNGKQWRKEPTELMGKSMGIIGLGSLGSAIASLALAYKMDVSYYGPHRKDEWESKGVSYKDKQSLLQTGDIVVISGPSNLLAIEANEFDQLKQGAILLQASQGDCFDKAAFIHWIDQEGNYAIFDYAAGHENYVAYKNLPHVIFSKVIAGHSNETKQRLGDIVYQKLKNYRIQCYISSRNPHRPSGGMIIGT